jgi:hypothetical protein
VVSVTDPFDRILARQEPLLFYQIGPQTNKIWAPKGSKQVVGNDEHITLGTYVDGWHYKNYIKDETKFNCMNFYVMVYFEAFLAVKHDKQYSTYFDRH